MAWRRQNLDNKKQRQCCRSDGKKWRCKRRAEEGHTLCSHHLIWKRHEVAKKKEGRRKASEELLQLCDDEGLALQGFRAQACYHAFQCLLLAGREPDEAAPWLRRARELLEASRGPGDPDVEQLRGYEADPSSHPAASDRSTQLSGLAGPVIVVAAAAAAFYFLR
eukprot:s2386_g6.t1